MTSIYGEIRSRKERLMNKMLSAYRGMRVGILRDIVPDLDFKGFYELWKQAWSDTYSSRPVFDCNAAYFEWSFGPEALSSPLSFAAVDESGLAGVVLHAHRTIIHAGKHITAGIPGALSIRPDIKGTFLARLLSLMYIEQAVQDLDALFLWFDTSTKDPQEVRKIYRRMYGHRLDLIDESVCIGTCSMKLKPRNARRVQVLFSVKQPEAFMSSSLVAFDRLFPSRLNGRLTPIDTETVDEAREFANRCAEEGEYGRVYGESEFRRYTLYSDPETGIGPLSALIRQEGRIRAIGVGYPITTVCLGKKDTTLFVPCLTFAPQCTRAERSAFASRFANMAGDACDACCTLTMCPVDMKARFIRVPQRFACFGMPLRGELSVVDEKDPTRTIDFR
jgi:hypothetical protein